MITEESSFCLAKHHHPSRGEAHYCTWLLDRKNRGEILDYRLYPSYPLFVRGVYFRVWKIDFEVVELPGTISVHESKDWATGDDTFILNRDVFIKCYPTIPLFINKRPYTQQASTGSVSARMRSIRNNKKKLTAERRKFSQKRNEFIKKCRRERLG